MRFAPSQTGVYNGQLILEGNDPELNSQAVTLLGEGLPPAKIEVDTGGLHVALLAGDTLKLELPIHNSGTAPLNWRVVAANLPSETESAFGSQPQGTSTQQGHPALQDAEVHTDRLIVRFEDEPQFAPMMAGGSRRASRADLAQAVGANTRRAHALVRNLEIWDVNELQTARANGIVQAQQDHPAADEIVAWLRQQPGVRYVEPDYVITVDPIDPLPILERFTSDGPSIISNDPLFGDLWGLHNTGQNGGVAGADIDATRAWLTQREAAEIIIAVIDTGVDYTHPDIAANMWRNPGEIPGNGLDDDGNGYIDDVFGYDFVNNNGNPMDDHNHGTHCAGTIAAVGDNGIGITGVAWRAQIMALKFLDSRGSGRLSDALLAIEYAYQNGAHIASNSWGGGGYTQAMQDVIAAANEAGMLFIAAAGNSSSDNDANPTYPANYDLPNVIAVAATTRHDTLANFSNFGAETVHLGAPGQAIVSTTINNSYASFSGTSMATPHVSGAAALLLARNPLLSPAQVKEILLNAVDPLPSLAGRVASGGRLNLRRTLEAASPPWLAPATRSGTVAPGETYILQVEFSADSMPAGITTGQLLIFSDDPVNSTLTIPASLSVTDAPGLAVQETELNFANVFVGGSSTQILTLRNSGTETLRIASILPSEGFVVEAPLPLVLVPGERSQVLVRALGLAEGAFHGSVRIYSTDPTDPEVSIALSGNSILPPKINPIQSRIDQQLRSGQVVSIAIPLRNDGAHTLEYAFGGEFPSWLKVGPASGSIFVGESLEVDLHLDASGMQQGQYAVRIYLNSNDPTLEQQALTVVINVVDGAWLAVNPQRVEYSVVYQGWPQAQTIEFHNRGNSTVNLSSPAITGSGFNLSQTPATSLAPGAKTTAIITANPAVNGSLQGYFTLNTTAPDLPLIQIPLTMEARSAPILELNPESFAFELMRGEQTFATLSLANVGMDVLDIGLAAKAQSSGRVFGQILQTFNVSAKTGDLGIVSVAWLNNRFYVGGRNSTARIPQIYVLDREGNLVNQFALPGVSAGSWGARDMTSDGFYLYAGWDGGIVKLDMIGNFVAALPKPSGVGAVNALAYDRHTGNFWVGDFYSGLIEMRPDGEVLRRIPKPDYMELMFGVAYDDVTPGGPYLWVAEIKELPTRRIHQFDPHTGTYTGLTFTMNPADGFSAGLDFTSDWQPGTATLLAINQDRDDKLHVINLADVQNWLTLQNYTASLAAGHQVDIEVRIDAEDVIGGTHVAEIIVRSNDPAQPERIVPVSLTVTGTPAIELPAPEIVFPDGIFANAVNQREFMIRNTGTDVLILTNPGVTGSGFSLQSPQSIAIQPQNTHSFEVRFQASTPGNYQGTLSFKATIRSAHWSAFRYRLRLSQPRYSQWIPARVQWNCTPVKVSIPWLQSPIPEAVHWSGTSAHTHPPF
ncbi:MAG: S8 family serine peptidase [Verrucomicrobia bacterium]|nr:S8 family serine peptidase [Verrucomicrobiota bacterium]